MSFTKVKYCVVASLAVLITACCDSSSDSGFNTKSGKTLYQEATQQLYAGNAQFNFKANISADTDADSPLLKDLKIKLSGAINNVSQRYEVVPEVGAAMFNFKLPMLLDGKNKELLLNTTDFIDAALLFFPKAKNELHLYKNKFIRFSPDNFKIDEKDMAQALIIASEALKIGAGAMNEIIDSLPESSIQKLPLDDKAKALNAKVVLKATLNSQQIQALQKHMNTYIYDSIAANKQLPQEFKQNMSTTLLEADNDAGYQSSESVIYLNEKGQVLHENNVFNYEIEGDKVNISMIVDYSNYGKASFTVSPDKNQITDFTEENIRSLQSM